MLDFLIRCSSVGKIMPEPKTKAEGILSKGAKTYIRQLVAQEIFGVEFEIGGKAIDKGLECEDESIALLNRVRGLSLAKNKVRKENQWLTGECDLFDSTRRRGHDLKTSWSLQTFPIVPLDCEDQVYFFQMQGYMDLWDAEEWEVNYAMVDTPERLIGYEPMQLHLVSHIPENRRLTTWLVKRDPAVIDLMHRKVDAAKVYAAEVLREFDRSHALQSLIDSGAPWASDAEAIAAPAPKAPTPKQTTAPAALPELF